MAQAEAMPPDPTVTEKNDKESEIKAAAKKALTPASGFKVDAIGRSYKVDQSGTRVYAKGSTRCPNTPYEVWKLMPPSAKKLIWEDYFRNNPEMIEPAAEPAAACDDLIVGRIDLPDSESEPDAEPAPRLPRARGGRSPRSIERKSQTSYSRSMLAWLGP